MGNKKAKIFNNLINLLKENQKLSLPIAVSQGTVKDDWIDYNGHMNMAYYVQCFEETSDFLLEHMNLGYRYAIEEQKGVFVIKCEINYRKEINLNEDFIISLEDLICKGKKLTVGLKMLNVGSETIADYQILNLNVDLQTKKSVPFSQMITSQLT
ncbi:MAG: thioesterase family protein [Proteobacteria bacterium]|jgi:acyl-CoA thioester hydrolase|nr:thioesterase family protein [Pseudomonadota bacterium]